MRKFSYCLFVVLSVIVLLVSCESEAEKKRKVIVEEATTVFADGFVKMQNEQLRDTLMNRFAKILSDSPELGLSYAYQFRNWVNSRANQKILNSNGRDIQQQGTETTTDTSEVSASDIAPINDKQALKKIKEFSKREYPDNYNMQQYTYNKQLSGYNYMKSVTEKELKTIAEREYYDDYAMQKYTYDKQFGAESYMREVADVEVKQIATREYPSDYAMQKYTYDKQLGAKDYMKSGTNQAAKSQAIREYPNDYSMQKYTYDKIAY